MTFGRRLEVFTHVKTIDEARAFLETGRVAFASLDDHLGACDKCSKGLTPDEWLEKSNYAVDGSTARTSELATTWCAGWKRPDTGQPVHWPTVHSANPAGRRRMEQAIERVREKARGSGREFAPSRSAAGRWSRRPGDPPGSSRSSHGGQADRIGTVSGRTQQEEQRDTRRWPAPERAATTAPSEATPHDLTTQDTSRGFERSSDNYRLRA